MQKLQINIALLIMLAVILATRSESRAENWPQFRGPAGLGVTGEKNLPITWSGEPIGPSASVRGPLGASVREKDTRYHFSLAAFVSLCTCDFVPPA